LKWINCTSFYFYIIPNYFKLVLFKEFKHSFYIKVDLNTTLSLNQQFYTRYKYYYFRINKFHLNIFNLQKSKKPGLK